MLTRLGQIRFQTHAVDIKQDQDTGRIYCFKFTPTRCDFDSFDSGEAAGDYILELFHTIRYYINVDGEDLV